ncbi:MAG: hypothetical protein HY298_22300 [Verrucomicrobia bacterium]|nr:hypothetical protein [Verrucomicrobiota bacterium]
MKSFNKILLVSAVAVGFNLAQAAKADEPLLSPRGKANQITRVPGINTDPDLVRGQLLGAAAKAQSARPTMIAGSSKNDPDLVHGVPYLAGKNPMRDLRGKTFEVAPLK